MTNKDVAELERLHDSTVKNLDKIYMVKQVARAGLPAPRVIGVDENAIRKGNDYRIIVSDLDRGRPIWVGGRGRAEEDLDLFFRELGKHKARRIKLVAMDMWKPFFNSAKKNVPGARVVSDKFHIVRHLNDALDKVRRREYHRLAGRDRSFIKGQRYTLLSHRENLNLEGRRARRKLFRANKRLKVAYLLKESFGQLWDYETEGWAQRFFERWREALRSKRLEPYVRTTSSSRSSPRSFLHLVEVPQMTHCDPRRATKVCGMKKSHPGTNRCSLPAPGWERDGSSAACFISRESLPDMGSAFRWHENRMSLGFRRSDMLRYQFTLRLEREEDTCPILERIAQVIEALDAERLLCALDRERGQGRDDYPNRVLWHCLVAFACLGVRSATEGIRYLQLSPALRRLCGIESLGRVPSKFSIYRFEKRLVRHVSLLEEMFAKLTRSLAERLPGFGERLATDSTRVHSLANGSKPAADPDASWKKYEHSYTDREGQPRKSAVKWFGYKLHLMVDALYELPLAAVLSTARENDAPQFERLWKRAQENVPDLLGRANSNALDKGYDDESVHQLLWLDGVEPIIAMRNMTAEENQDLLPENQQRCPDNRPLRFDGLERARGALRYDLPKDCPKVSGRGHCQLLLHCHQKLQRIKLVAGALRHLGPVPRESKKFKRLYRGRTAAERVNGRLKGCWGLDCVRRCGSGRVQVWAQLALLCMNAFALSMAEAGRLSDVRKTVWSIAA